MQSIPRSVALVIEELTGLPGIGPRTAERLTFYLLRSQAGHESRLGKALLAMRDQLHTCSQCYNFAESATCAICNHPSRQKNVITVVEEPLDVVAIEKTGLYTGLYHVLGGVISPIDGIGPGQLQIQSLIDRVASDNIEEVVLATNPTTEGEATALFIRKQLESHHITLTRLARGLPVGGDLEYADQVTLGRALQERQTF